MNRVTRERIKKSQDVELPKIPEKIQIELKRHKQHVIGLQEYEIPMHRKPIDPSMDHTGTIG